MAEDASPGRPTEATVRTLLVKACGRCSFAGCASPLVDPVTHVPTLRVAHIKARRPGGPRYDPTQSEVARHAYPNLILLCAAHGDVIDKASNIATYTVERLLSMKAAHEASCTEVDIDATDAVVHAVLALSESSTVVSILQAGGQTAQTIFNIGAQGTPPAEVELYVAGNTATEDWARWYHVAARSTTESVALQARVSVVHQTRSIAPEQWRWQGGAATVDIRRTGMLIPLVVGGVRHAVRSLTVGWYVAEGCWYLTPLGNQGAGRFFAAFVPNERHLFDVTVSWVEGGLERQANASFELRFWRKKASDPRFIRVGVRPTYMDQAGGLGELRDAGVALRNRGSDLPDPSAVDPWRSEVEDWALEAESLIAEVSASEASMLRTLDTFAAVQFPGARIHGDSHLLELQVLHEKIERLTQFMTSGRIAAVP